LRGGDHRAEGLPRQTLGEGEGRGPGCREGDQREGTLAAEKEIKEKAKKQKEKMAEREKKQKQKKKEENEKKAKKNKKSEL